MGRLTRWRPTLARAAARSPRCSAPATSRPAAARPRRASVDLSAAASSTQAAGAEGARQPGDRPPCRTGHAHHAERERAAGQDQDDRTAVTEPAAPARRSAARSRRPGASRWEDRRAPGRARSRGGRRRPRAGSPTRTRSERDADQAADSLDVQRAGHDVGEPIPTVSSRAGLAPAGSRPRTRRARRASRAAHAGRRRSSKSPCR